MEEGGGEDCYLWKFSCLVFGIWREGGGMVFSFYNSPFLPLLLLNREKKINKLTFEANMVAVTLRQSAQWQT